MRVGWVERQRNPSCSGKVKRWVSQVLNPSYGLPPPAPAPTAAEAAATAQQPHHKQKQDGANGGVDDRRNNSGPEMDAELRQQPVANERADYSDDEIADQSESGPAHDLA